jgi:hypothetical protein
VYLATVWESKERKYVQKNVEASVPSQHEVGFLQRGRERKRKRKQENEGDDVEHTISKRIEGSGCLPRVFSADKGIGAGQGGCWNVQIAPARKGQSMILIVALSLGGPVLLRQAIV